MTDTTTVPDYAEQLEPYRGQKGKLFDRRLGLGEMGIYALWRLSNGSPTAAGEFLGYDVRSGATGQIGDRFTMAGLPVQKRDWAANAKHVEGQLLQTKTDEECLQDYLQETSAVEYADCYEWRVPKGEEFATCVMMGDLHLGASDCDFPRIMALRDWIAANPAVRWCALGDIFNLNTKNSKGGLDPVSLAKSQKIARALFRPIAKQAIAVIEGNHDLRPALETGVAVSVLKELCAELEMPHYGASSVFVRVRVLSGKDKQEYDGFLHHGWGGARTPGGKRKYLFDMIDNLDCDFFFMGHVHDRDVAEKVRMALSSETEVIDGKEKCMVERQERIMGIVGSFQRWLPDSYARNKGMPPASLGSISAQFGVRRHTIHGRK